MNAKNGNVQEINSLLSSLLHLGKLIPAISICIYYHLKANYILLLNRTYLKNNIKIVCALFSSQVLSNDFPLFLLLEKNYLNFFFKLESLIQNRNLKKPQIIFYSYVFSYSSYQRHFFFFGLKLKSIKQLQIFKTVANVTFFFIHCILSTV